MLPYRSHWQFAPERNLFGEARLLCFASTPDDTVWPQPEELDPDSAFAPPETFNPHIAAHATATVESGTRHTRSAIASTLDDDEDDEPLVPPQLTDKEKEAIAEKKKKEEEAEVLRQQDKEKRRESMREKLKKVVKALEDESVQMRSLRDRMKDPDILERINKYGDANVKERWHRDMKALESEVVNTAREKQFAVAFQTLWEGEGTPQAFLTEQEDYLKHLPYGFDTIGTALNEFVHNHAPSGGEGDNASEKIAAAQAFRDQLQIDGWIASQADLRKKIKKLLDKKSEWVKGIEEQSDAILMEKNVTDPTSFTKALFALRFYSINNYIHGVQKYWAALMKTLEDRNERFDADVARSLGRAMRHLNFWPLYGESVNSILEQQLESKGNEEKDAKKGQLDRQGARWADLFSDPHGEFWHLAESNANEARGLLEYAADHGFLYEIDEVTSDPNMPIYGIPLTRICRDWEEAGEHQKVVNYFSTLRAKNSAGRDSEISNGKKTVEDIESVDKFIDLLRGEMDDMNLWSTTGICQRAIERGLNGEVSARLFTTIMQKLRSNRELQKVAPKIFFDLIGKISMYNTAFTLGWAKGYRKELRNWAKTGNESHLNNTAISHFAKIEQDIKAKDPSTDYNSDEGRKELSDKLALVLSGSILELPGGYIHIYQDKFTSYRDKAEDMFAAVATPHKEDTDYAINTTEKTMLPVGAFDNILAYTSTREFDSKDWVEPFFTSITRTAIELKQIPQLRDAYDNYLKEVSRKLNEHFRALKDEPLADKQLLAKGYGGKPGIAKLVVEGLLSWEKIKNAKWAPALAEQLKNDPDFYDFWARNIATSLPTTSGGGGSSSSSSTAPSKTTSAA